ITARITGVEAVRMTRIRINGDIPATRADNDRNVSSDMITSRRMATSRLITWAQATTNAVIRSVSDVPVRAAVIVMAWYPLVELHFTCCDRVCHIGYIAHFAHIVNAQDGSAIGNGQSYGGGGAMETLVCLSVEDFADERFA